MPTADPSNVLFKIAHPDLYERNPFNLLNLPINATARDIRRRKEDIEAAFEAGTEAEEFRFVLPVDANRQSPTREAVNEAFEVLNEPDLRIAYALFWFWPDGGSKKTSNPNRDLAEWMASFDEDVEANVATADITSQFLERHNLAVYKHLSAISMEDPIRRLNTILSQTQDLVFAQRKLADKQIEKIVKDVAAEYVAFNPRFRNVDILLDAVRKFLDTCDIELDEAQVREYYSRRSTIDDRIKDDSCNAPDVLLQWNEAIELWNSVVSDADFWHSVSEMVSALNDPRLDYRFARSLRDQFAFAFDQINVELAIEFAKTGRESDAKRQVEYMKLSQPDADDVEGTFDDAFAGLLRQTEAICKTAQDETDKNPKDGLRQANLILEQTDEPLRVSRIVLEKGTTIRNAIVTVIFSAVRNCLVAYGNKTTDWDGCLGLTLKLENLAETPEQTRMLAEDKRVIAGNKKAKEEEETCWFCKQRYSSSRPRQPQTIRLWGDMRMGAQFGQVTFSQRSIEVPMCGTCACGRSPSDHPSVKRFLDAGWHVGAEPSQDDIRRFWGLPEPPKAIPRPQQSGCLVPICLIICLIFLGTFL